ncbi:MAG: universal stress protein [Bacteroidales bacterium]|nr:universal stress protein [Bacteroidales bacterium]HPD95115.1 universal stress protein [Tenuifilaceae bacterium]HRX31525.1 universal stress protein [Tenuifilaceae bacterium]
MISKKRILVPTDFSEVAGYALQHAVRVSEVVKEPISILHIVQAESEIPSAQEKINSIVKGIREKYGKEIVPIVKVGSYFTDIALVASEINASMVIMGSSTIKDMDENKVSWVLKVITSCKVPFITIQEPPVNKRYDDIVFPIDYTVENKMKHRWISYFSDFYLSRFHLIKPKTTDPELLAKIDMNMASAKKYIDEKGARYIEYTVPGRKRYEEEVLDMSVNIRADLIVLMTTPVSNGGKFEIDPIEQHILANSHHIPVMCVNPM